jgi:NAD(P)H-dependent flavin oxidoreductase YrpB (nitropropane dioxygenase family)
VQVKALTDKNFGVNFHMYQPNAADIVDMVIQHGVKAVSYSRSPGPEFIQKLKSAGVICMPTVGLPKHAIKAVELGADVVTVQGGEGGGHTGKVPTTLLIPQVIDAVGSQVPVVAAGGFKDGRGLLAAMAWGADGIAMGTRFLLTRESPVPNATLQRYLDCKNPGDIIVSRAMDGLPQRMIMNELLADLEKASGLKKLIVAVRNGLAFRKHTGASVFGLFKSAIAMSRDDDMTAAQAIMSANAPMIIQKAMVDGEPSQGVLPSGQVAGVIDELLSCEELINAIVLEAEQRLSLLALRVSEV